MTLVFGRKNSKRKIRKHIPLAFWRKCKLLETQPAHQHNLSHVLDVFTHRPDGHLHILPRPWWDRLNSVAHGSSMLGQLDDHTIRPPRWWALLARYASIQMWYTICLFAICTHRTERYAMQECNGLRGICLRTPKLANFKLPLNHKSPHCDKPHNSI